jgi:hypothetical protein
MNLATMGSRLLYDLIVARLKRCMTSTMVDPANDILKPRIKYTPKVNPNLLLHAEDLLSYYSFDLGQQSAATVLQTWATTYPVQWIRWAIIEALYQGRYKAVSVAQILQIWARRKQPQTRFDADFEKLICERLPRKLIVPSSAEGESAIAALAAEIHATGSTLSNSIPAASPAPSSTPSSTPLSHNQEAALAALARVVQNRKSFQPSVNMAINHVEANLDANLDVVAEHTKHQFLADSSQSPPTVSTSEPTPESVSPVLASQELEPDSSIHQFTPNPLNLDLLEKLRSVSSQPRSSQPSTQPPSPQPPSPN